jgi:hypothetical protein
MGHKGLVGSVLSLSHPGDPLLVFARCRSSRGWIQLCIRERPYERGRFEMGKGRTPAQHISDLHAERNFIPLDSIKDEHPQSTVEVDEFRGVPHGSADPIVVEDPYPWTTVAVHVRLRLTEWVEIAGKPVVTNRAKQLNTSPVLGNADTAQGKLFDLVLDR